MHNYGQVDKDGLAIWLPYILLFNEKLIYILLCYCNLASPELNDMKQSAKGNTISPSTDSSPK